MQDRHPANFTSPSEADTGNEAWVEICLDPFTTDISKADHRALKNLALVLTARGIPCQQIPQKKPRQLLVQSHDMETAVHEISIFIDENRTQPAEQERFNHHEDNSLQTISVLLLIGIFHNLTYLNLAVFGTASIDWLQLGNADADLIRAGEWWRTITALTLHADGRHLMGNLLIGGYFVIRLCRLLGGGLGWNVILWSGILGNTINALLHFSAHRSVGASTALFGAIGAAGMIGLMRHRRVQSRYWILPVAAATGLLAMLGAGGADTATDIGAHLFGFGSGLLLGWITGKLILHHGLPDRRMNIILAMIALITPIGAWVRALIIS